MPLLCIAETREDGTLRSTEAIRRLPREVQGKRPPVDLECVVLCLLDGSPLNLQIWQDGTALYVNAAAAAARGVKSDLWRSLRPGDRVRLRGHVTKGYFAPTVDPIAIDFLSHGALPEPRPVVASDLASGQLDGQWASISGVVQAVSPRYKGRVNSSLLEMGSAHGLFTAHIDGSELSHFIGSEVRLQGLCLPYFNYRMQMLGLMIHLRSVDDITVLRPAEEDPFSAPEVLPMNMQEFDPEEGTGSSRRILKGVVISREPGSHLLVHNRGYGIKVGLAPDQSASVGDLVEASGFVRLNGSVAELAHALVRTAGTGPLPDPVSVSTVTLSRNALVQPGISGVMPDLHNRLVTLHGVLIHADTPPVGSPMLWIKNSGAPPLIIPVTVPAGFQFPPIGSVVEALGICEMVISRKPRDASTFFGESLKITLSRVQDLKVLERPAWWTPLRLRILTGVIITLLALALFQMRKLHHRVRLSWRAMKEALQKQQAAETRSEERQRLAEEIHDTMAQNLTGVALQIGAAGMASAAAPPEVSQHLKLASGLLDFAREEIRRTLFDLRSGQLENGNLTETLHNITRMITKSRACDVDWEVSGTAPYVHPLAAHSLLRVAQESLNNSIKHGRASRILVLLHYSESSVRLTITDNGHGCGPEPLPGPMQGHFGLENMRGWVRRLEGDFHFHSLPGSGTAVTVTVPVQLNNPNPSSVPSPPSPQPSLRSSSPVTAPSTGVRKNTGHDSAPVTP